MLRSLLPTDWKPCNFLAGESRLAEGTAAVQILDKAFPNPAKSGVFSCVAMGCSLPFHGCDVDNNIYMAGNYPVPRMTLKTSHTSLYESLRSWLCMCCVTPIRSPIQFESWLVSPWTTPDNDVGLMSPTSAFHCRKPVAASALREHA